MYERASNTEADLHFNQVQFTRGLHCDFRLGCEVKFARLNAFAYCLEGEEDFFFYLESFAVHASRNLLHEGKEHVAAKLVRRFHVQVRVEESSKTFVVDILERKKNGRDYLC